MKYLFVFLLVGLTSSVIGQNRYHISETDEPEASEGVVLISTNKTVTGVVYDEHENGQLRYESNYEDGKEDGLSREWYSDGQLHYEGNYKDDRKDGLTRWWNENGQLMIEGNYKDGNLLSEKCWDKDGNEIQCPQY